MHLRPALICNLIFEITHIMCLEHSTDNIRRFYILVTKMLILTARKFPTFYHNMSQGDITFRLNNLTCYHVRSQGRYNIQSEQSELLPCKATMMTRMLTRSTHRLLFIWNNAVWVKTSCWVCWGTKQSIWVHLLLQRHTVALSPVLSGKSTQNRA